MSALPAGNRSLTDRIMGVLRLDAGTYREIERDTEATPQALVVVVLVVIAQAIGSLGGDGERERSLVGMVIGGALSAILGWIAFSIVAYLVGTALFKSTTATPGRVLRLIGFAQAPKLIGVLGFIPILGGIVSLIAFVWFIATAITALRESLDIDGGQAVVTALVAGLVMVAVGLVIALVLGLTVGLTAALISLIF